MTTPNAQVRRATVDDIQALVALWKQERLPWEILEKRFKEFQVVEGEGGEILAALGFQIAGGEGRLHSEAFAHPEQADRLRKLLWERAQVQAKNHGLVRIWTQLATPFWRSTELQTAEGEVLTKLPSEFGGFGGAWYYLQLREEGSPSLSLDQEFKLFQEAEKESTERLFRQAKILRVAAAVLSLIVLILLAIWAISFFRVQSRMRHRQSQLPLQLELPRQLPFTSGRRA
jgi:N-acetylglutamate synthase-like GNAT family acetyltransferase